MICFVSIFLLLINVQTAIGAASNSLNDCYALAARFRTTCPANMTSVPSILSTAGVNVTCTSAFTNSTCPGIWSNGICIFAHKLCITCSAGPPVRIRVQSNGLPQYCPNAPQPISEQNIDFTVNFNPDVNVSSPNQNPTSLAALNSIVCSISNQASAPSGSNLVVNGSPLNTLAAVSIDGVSILNVNSANNVDPFYPTGNFSAETVDECLGHPNPQNMYHYHMGTGCALTQPTRNISTCLSTPPCGANIANYSISSFNSYRSLTVIGIAKDGHIIYGPYDSSTAEVRSGFDICNGMFHDSIGNYGYFVTRTYPYITGCFGPGNYPNFTPSCTTNGPSGYTMSVYALNQTLGNMTTPANMTGPPPTTTTTPPSNMTGPPPPTTTTPPSNMTGPPPTTTTVPSNMTGPPPTTTTSPFNMTGPPPTTTTAPSNMTGPPPTTTVPSNMTGPPPTTTVPSNMTGPPPTTTTVPSNMTAPPSTRPSNSTSHAAMIYKPSVNYFTILILTGLASFLGSSFVPAT